MKVVCAQIKVLEALMTTSNQLEISHPSESHQAARIALVNMPFASTSAPSIQCGLLKAELVRAGHVAKVYYLNLELAAEIGAKNYEAISDSRYANSLLGEWLFSSAAFGHRENEQEYLAACPGLRKLPPTELEWLFKLRREILPDFICRWTKRIAWDAYDAVGFTSTFVQNNATFALARSIKNQHPRIATIFGGANFDGGMGREFLRKLSFIDYVVDGEGENALFRLANRLATGESGVGIPGVSARTSEGIVEGGRATKVTVMDVLPEPDYDDYFETMWRLGREKVMSIYPMLPFETARGCWWGEKHHCTFCGLNANDMGFRSKTPERVLDELKNLTDRYQTLNIQVVDNIINVKYIDKVCKPLIQEHCDYSIFWEVKANLTPAQLRTMSSAGIVHLQPGIESLSTHVLELMRKGITMLKNVRFLKWASYFRMSPRWNVITGFPGETAEDYARQRRLIPLLKHLPPPRVWGPLWLERYSPYFFDPSFPVEAVTPAQAYNFLFPESNIDLREVAYFFDYKMGNTVPVENHEGMFALLHAWKESWDNPRPPTLVFRRGPGWIEVSDRRGEKLQHSWLYGVEASAYESCCETDHTVEAVLRIVRDEMGDAKLKDVEAALKKCCDLGIMIEEDGHYLSLAQPLNRNWFLDRTSPPTQSTVNLRILEPSLAVRST
jgi:ribosomal peptide maturation radical SAM protein 1